MAPGKRRKAARFPPKMAGTPKAAKKAKRAAKFIFFAKEVLKGEKEIPSRPYKGRGAFVFTDTFNAFAKAVKENPYAYDRELAAKISVSEAAASKWRSLLVKQGKILDIKSAERHLFARRKPMAKTVLTEKRRRIILKAYASAIQFRAQQLYSSTKEAFDFFHMLPKDIEAKLTKSLDSRLQVFNPKRELYGHKSARTKLRRFFDTELFYAYGSLEWRIKRKYAAAKLKGKPIKEKTVPAAKPSAEYITTLIDKMERASKQLDLTPMKKAVFFGLIAGFSEAEIGRQLWVSRESIRQTKEGLKKMASEFFLNNKP